MITSDGAINGRVLRATYLWDITHGFTRAGIQMGYGQGSRAKVLALVIGFAIGISGAFAARVTDAEALPPTTCCLRCGATIACGICVEMCGTKCGGVNCN